MEQPATGPTGGARRTDAVPAGAVLAPVRGAHGRLARVGLFLSAYLAVLLVTSVPKGLVPSALADVTWGTLASLGLVVLTRRMTRDRASRDGTRRLSRAPASARRLLMGAAVGLSSCALTLGAIATLIGPLRASTSTMPGLMTILCTVAGFLALSCMEELGFRGYPLRELVAVSGERAAVLTVSILFAASHALFGWPLETILLGVLPSGVLFGWRRW